MRSVTYHQHSTKMAVDVVQEINLLLEKAEDGIKTGDPTVIGVLVAIGLVLLTILYFALSRGRNKRRGVLLMGLCDSGKTLIFSQLVNKKFVQTYTSMKENSGMYYPVGKEAKPLRIVDLPGHERTRYQFITQFRDLARGIVFVVDSTTIQKEYQNVAEYLYSILTDGVVARNLPPLVVACNKHDQTLAKGIKVVKSLLEKEINTLRVTRSAMLDGTDDTSNNNSFLGKRNKPFEFGDLRPLSVEFVECSGVGCHGDSGSNAELQSIEDWLRNIS